MIYRGEEIKKHVPTKILIDLVDAFKDANLSFDNDIQYCSMEIKPKGTCWITDTRDKTFFYRGKLIAAFNIDGSGFHSSNSNKNLERASRREKIRNEFFKVPRKAKELYELDRLLEL